MLLAQDLYILLKLAVHRSEPWTFSQLSKNLGISTSQLHLGLSRAETSRLYLASERRVIKQALGEFILHGVKYSFPAVQGKIVRGMPTSFAAFPFKENFFVEPGVSLPVWPDPEGEARGYAIEPLHSGAPRAAKRDEKFYELLAMVDVIREGRAREKHMAKSLISDWFNFWE